MRGLLRAVVDRWRQGPEVRAAEAAMTAARARSEELETRVADLEKWLGNADERARLLSELVRSGLKARCHAGCGQLVWAWQPQLVEVDGRPMLVPVCDECRRARAARARRAQEDAEAQAAAAAASPKIEKVTPASPAAG